MNSRFQHVCFFFAVTLLAALVLLTTGCRGDSWDKWPDNAPDPTSPDMRGERPSAYHETGHHTYLKDHPGSVNAPPEGVGDAGTPSPRRETGPL